MKNLTIKRFIIGGLLGALLAGGISVGAVDALADEVPVVVEQPAVPQPAVEQPVAPQADVAQPVVEQPVAPQADVAQPVVAPLVVDGVVVTDPQVIMAYNEQAAYAAMLQQNTLNFFNNSVFVGDSIMVGFNNYMKNHPESLMGATKFLTVTSYSAWHAIRGIGKDSLQPVYNGSKGNVWDQVAAMGAERVFMMFGTNDLVMCSVDKTEENILSVAKKIAAAKPGVKIYIISMVPVYANVNKGGLSNENIKLLNSKLQADAALYGYHFVDLNSYLKGTNGAILPAYSSDKYVHQNNKAYKVWEGVFCDYAGKHFD